MYYRAHVLLDELAKPGEEALLPLLLLLILIILIIRVVPLLALFVAGHPEVVQQRPAARAPHVAGDHRGAVAPARTPGAAAERAHISVASTRDTQKRALHGWEIKCASRRAPDHKIVASLLLGSDRLQAREPGDHGVERRGKLQRKRARGQQVVELLEAPPSPRRHNRGARKRAHGAQLTKT